MSAILEAIDKLIVETKQRREELRGTPHQIEGLADVLCCCASVSV